jgi:hypothetical protein
MRQLLYTLYLSGRCGLSNAIMSTEVGVVLAHLTNRFLLLDGNRPPAANLVSYDGRVDHSQPSRVTDLIDLPVPWGDDDPAALVDAESLELTNYSLSDTVFCFPSDRDRLTADATYFARGRQHWVTVADQHDHIPVLRLSEQPLVPGVREPMHRRNLCFYSYLFYLDQECRRSAYRTLARMVAKEPYRDLARRVASDLGTFNAVHLRRGDFKLTYGVTTLERKPWEAIDAMDRVFSRDDPLVILTDEREDPFFREICAAFPNSLFIDWHILDAYQEDFARLPQRDSLCLAHLSQLVAGESAEFIGTMTSTFSALIQRYRGNHGHHEPFRFFWNELPDEGSPLERGRHALSECIALDAGVMVEEQEGSYSWNRVSQRLNPAWMREWPESFLLASVLDTGLLPRTREQPEREAPDWAGAHRPSASFSIGFEGLQVAVQSSDPGLLQQLAPVFGYDNDDIRRNVIAQFKLRPVGDRYEIMLDGAVCAEAATREELTMRLREQVVELLGRVRPGYAWLRGATLARNGRALMLASNADTDVLVRALEPYGFERLEAGIVPTRMADLTVIPFGSSARPEGAGERLRRSPTPLAGIAVATPQLQARDTLTASGPALAVTELIRCSAEFSFDRDRAVERLCRLCEARPVVQLRFSREDRAAELIATWSARALDAGAA